MTQRKSGLRNLLVIEPVREIGGATAQLRFDYQTVWGARRILFLYKLGTEFGLGFEFHDDLIEIEDTIKPNGAKFFQVKTKSSGKWSEGSLTKIEKGSSILGKLLANKVKFKEHFAGGFIVSNAQFSFLGSESQQRFSSLAPKKQSKILTAILAELSISDATFVNDIEFWCDPNPITSQEGLFTADLVDLVEREFGPIRYNPKAFALSMLDSCRTKSKRYTADVTNFDELLKAKFVTRSDVAVWLGHVKQEARFRPNLDIALQQCPATKRKWLTQNWTLYEINRKNVNDLSSEVLREEARRIIAQDNVADDIETLGFTALRLLEILRETLKEQSIVRTDDYLFCCLAYELLTGEENLETRRTISKAHTQSQDASA